MPSYKDQMYGFYYDEMALAHHGVKGQKWGVRRYQNEDGTRTAAGRRHEQALNSSENGRINNIYGTEGNARSVIKKNYKNAKRSAFERSLKRSDKIDSEADSKLTKNEALRKSGKITNKQAKANADKIISEAGKKYDEEDRKYKSEKQAAKAQYHENRARMFENRANLSTEASNNNVLLRGLNDSRRGKATIERAKRDLASAKSSGDKKAVANATKNLGKTYVTATMLGSTTRFGAYNRYRDNGASAAKAVLKVAVGGSLFSE